MTRADGAGAPRRGYLAVLRDHPEFRRLYLARTVSLLGDWFNLFAVLSLLGDLGEDSAAAVGWVLILKLLPLFLLGPVAGVVADRFSRKSIMIWSDVGRAVAVAALLLVELVPAGTVPLVYAITAIQIGLAAFFEPARTASVPNLVPERDLTTANALGAVTWSVMFTLGAAIGGLLTHVAGWQIAVVADVLTYTVSAALVARIRLPRRPARPSGPVDLWTLTGLRDMKDGLDYVRARPRVAALLLTKAGWGVAGAMTLVLTWFGQRVYTVAGSPEIGVGVLYVARAVGTAVGPLLAQRLAAEVPARMRKLIVVGFVTAGLAYAAFSFSRSLGPALVAIVIGHMGGAVVWTFSTVLLQLRVEDDYRGRIFAAELGLATVMISVSTFFYARALDQPDADPYAIARILGLSLLVPATAAMWADRRLWRRSAAPARGGGRPDDGGEVDPDERDQPVPWSAP